jgi:small multidrug resistance family-3 protein
MNIYAWLIFAAAALLEVGGDAVIRRGLRGRQLWLVLAGIATLGCYGLLVNSVKWDFSRLIGVYVGVFALISVWCGRVVFREHIPATTWVGLGIIISGCLVIQFGKP